jgi:hypothetical protein
MIGLTQFQRLKSGKLILFVYFILYTLLTEVLGLYFRYVLHTPNHVLYNIYSVVQMAFISYVYYSIVKSKAKLVIKIGFILFLLYSLVNFLFLQDIMRFDTILYRVSSLLIIFCVLSFFKQLWNSEENVHPRRNPLFWISTGFLFYHLGFFVFLSVFDYLVYNNIQGYYTLWNYITSFINVILYSCISIGFLCKQQVAI